MDDELPETQLDEIERAARTAVRGQWRWIDAHTLVTESGASALTKARNRVFIERLTPDLAIRMVEEIRFLRRLEQIHAESTAPQKRKSSRPLTARRG